MRRLIISFLSLLFPVAILAQQVVHGNVVDNEQQAVIGATVMIAGGKDGTVTNLDGDFVIEVPSGEKIIVSYIGMESQTLTPVDGMRVVLKPTAESLGEVVVTGMQRMDRRLFTGATAKISAEDTKLDGVADISRSLEGHVAGVSVQNVSGTFGTAPKIRVRGATSIYGSSKPLWVVDGVIMDDVTEVGADELSSGDAVTLISSAIAGLNSDDIESFQILKDGSATSIYGARAMAGVIVVTTKKGKAGKSRISYAGEYTLRLKPSYRDFNIMNSQEQMSVYREMRQKGWLNFADTYRAESSGVYGKMYQLMNTYDEQTHTWQLANTVEAEMEYLRGAEYRNTNWFDELFSNAIQHNHSIGISGGTDKLNFYGSLSAMLDPGWYEQSKVNRYTANMNVSYNISDKVNVNIITSGSYRKQKAPGTLGQTADPVSGTVKRDFDINPYSFALNSSRTLDPEVSYTRNFAPFNIHHELENNHMNMDVADLKFQAELKYRPIRPLELSALGAVKYAATSQEHIITDYSNQAMAYRAMDDATIRTLNPYLYTDPDNPYNLPVTILPQGGIYRKTNYKMNGYNMRLTANFNKTFQQAHITNVFGGMELDDIQRNSTFFNGWGMLYSEGELPFYVYQYFKQQIEQGGKYYSIGNTRSRSVAFFLNATYSYKGRYTLNGTVRYEGTNRLGKSRTARWLPTWNLSAAWNVHEEDFFEKMGKWLSHLSLKASYSLTGDPGPSSVSNSSMVLMSFTPYRPFTSIQESGMYIVDLANDELTYEKKHELNMGFDVGFLSNRVNFSFDWYLRNNYDLIGAIETPGVGGQIRKLANVASMKSHGLEFTLSTKNVQGKDLSWQTDFIFSYAKNEVSSLMSSASIMDVVQGAGFALEGYPVRSLFSFRYGGLDDKGYPRIVNQDGKLTSEGTEINFQSQHLDQLKYEGPTDPTVTGSLGNILKWRNFRLNVFVTYSMGNVVRLDPVFASSYSDLDAMPKEFRNRWVQPGDESTTGIPGILTARQVAADYYTSTLYSAYNYSTDRIAKGDFIRMKELSLSYDFPQKWASALHVADVNLKLQATNLFLIYSDKKLGGNDPEFFRSGGVAAPMPKQFTLTLRLGI